MYRTLCVLALLTLQAGLAHSFSWDLVAGGGNRLEFYNEEQLTYSVTFTDVEVKWITYDPFHNRVLLLNRTDSVQSYDIATGKIQTLIHLAHDIFPRYDPATGLLFAITNRPLFSKMYSYLVKPGSNHEVDANFVRDLGGFCFSLAVDSCGGYIYWITGAYNSIERARMNGSPREEVEGRTDNRREALTIDPQTQNMYWVEYDYKSKHFFILSADLNGKNRRTVYKEFRPKDYFRTGLTFTKDFIYWTDSESDQFFWKIPKYLPLGTDVEPKRFAFNYTPNHKYFKSIAANYAIEEQPQGTALCKALKRLLPNYSATNDSDSLNVSTGGSLLRVNATKVSEESRVSGDIDVSVCHNYCLQGNCSVSAEGQPKCRCSAGYSGVRCEVNTCQAYCLNDGVCAPSEDNNPVCQCTEGYQGVRCDVPALLIKCSQTVSLLKDILNADYTSVTEGKGVKSTCAVV